MIANKAIEQMTRDEMSALQLKRLQKQVNWALEKSAYYYKVFSAAGINKDTIQSLDDIRKIPFTTPDDLEQVSAFDLLTLPISAVLRISRQGGKRTFKKIYTSGDLAYQIEMLTRVLVAHGINKSTVVGLLGESSDSRLMDVQYALENIGATVLLLGTDKENIKELEMERRRLEKEHLAMHTAYVTDASVLEHCSSYLEKKKALEEEDWVVKSLFRTANGRLTGSAKIDFETYIQRQYFKQIIHEANKRLLTMSGHQFMLKLKETSSSGRKSNEGLDLSVYSLVTDSERDIKTLSGGESFLAALAMALGLSDIATRKAGAVHLDMMFIDEGFGSLDEQSRKQAIEVLDQLAGGDRLVGIISHVTELKEQIDHRLLVTRTDKGSKAVWEY